MSFFIARAASRPLLVGLAGALGLWLGFPNNFVSVPILVLLYPCALAFLGLSAPGAGAAFRQGWLTGIVGGAGALYWLALPIHNVGGLPLSLAIPAALFATACVTSAGGLFALAAYLLRARSPLLNAVRLGLFWYILEAVYAQVLGFPWLPLSGALVVWPITVQAADLLGAYAVGGLWVMVALLCTLPSFPRPHMAQATSNTSGTEACSTSHLHAGDSTLLPPRKRTFSFAVAMWLLGLIMGYGHLQLQENPLITEPLATTPSATGTLGTESLATNPSTADPLADPLAGKSSATTLPAPRAFSVLFVEGNIDQNQKWLPTFQRRTVDLYLNLTQVALDARPSEKPLIIWPETALPFAFEANKLYTPRIRELAARSESYLLTGVPGLTQNAGQKNLVFNRALLLGPDGATHGYYDKEHLVPFGEYVPNWLNWEIFSALLQEVGIYHPGMASAPLKAGDLALGMLICYEGIFPWLAQARVADGATVLVDISNDGWFGDSPAPAQHLYLTALRGLEQNRWVLRGTNTGISAVMDARGRIVMRGEQFKAQALWGQAKTVHILSFYHAVAPWVLPIATLFFCILLLGGRPSPSTTHIRHAASE